MKAGTEEVIDDKQWKELFRYVLGRCFGGPEEAEDLTQEIFSRLVNDGKLSQLRRKANDDVHFMALLKNAARWHIIDTHRAGQTRKRIAWTRRVSLDDPDHLVPAPAARGTAERYYLVERLVAEGEQLLCREYRDRGDGSLFDSLKDWLVADSERTPSCAAMAARSGRSPGAFRVALHRARKRYREIVRERLALAA